MNEKNLKFNPKFLKEMKEIDNDDYITIEEFNDLFDDE